MDHGLSARISARQQDEFSPDDGDYIVALKLAGPDLRPGQVSQDSHGPRTCCGRFTDPSKPDKVLGEGSVRHIQPKNIDPSLDQFDEPLNRVRCRPNGCHNLCASHNVLRSRRKPVQPA
jgi:hypothetical protein